MDFRKLVSFVFASILLVSLAACESQGTKPSEASSQEPTEQPQKSEESKPEEKPQKCECPAQEAPKTNLEIIGETEYVRVIPGDVVLQARIDTGATSTSMTALDMTEFERDGKTWVKFYVPGKDDKRVEISRPVNGWVSIKQHSGQSVRRPIVMMTLILGDREQTLKVNLTDRSKYTYPLLIGRNFLQGVMMVDVSQKNTQGIPNKAPAK